MSETTTNNLTHKIQCDFQMNNGYTTIGGLMIGGIDMVIISNILISNKTVNEKGT